MYTCTVDLVAVTDGRHLLVGQLAEATTGRQEQHSVALLIEVQFAQSGFRHKSRRRCVVVAVIGRKHPVVGCRGDEYH